MLLRRRLSAAAVAVLATVASTGLSPGGAGAASPGPRVSVISDSILTAVTWSNGPAQAVLTNGLDMQIDAAVCRRLNGQSCEFNGAHAPTTLSVISSWITQLGSIVVIVDGYNDLPANFAGDVELTLNTLRDHGVQHVLWVDLRESRPEFAAKNAVLFAAAKQHPELHVLDWNSFSAPHPEWYQSDWIHLMPAGGLAIAGWIRQAIADTIAPPPPPAPPPKLTVPAHLKLRGRVGVRFDRRLRAGATTAPLRWRTKGPVLRRTRLHLSASGELSGTPSRAGTFALPLEVTDGGGATAHVMVSLILRPTSAHSKKR
jgi:hypothetical protein